MSSAQATTASGAGFQAAKAAKRSSNPSTSSTSAGGLSSGNNGNNNDNAAETTKDVDSFPDSGGSETIKVLIRIRPLIDREKSAGYTAPVIQLVQNTSVEIHAKEFNLKCKYDTVLPGSATQEQVYHSVEDCAATVLQGFNSTLFAYGQTGSGKTHTMFGPEDCIDKLTNGGQLGPRTGIIPRVVRDLLTGAKELEEKTGDQISVFCSFVQLYNENLFDLLRDGKRDNPLTIHEDSRHGIYVENLSEYTVKTPAECLSLLKSGQDNRATRSTQMNQASSRSHSLFQLLVERTRASDRVLVRSKLNLVDLAGSEKWSSSGSMEAIHIDEMTNINLSLHTLGRCIAALSSSSGSNQVNPFVPYRDSKLTRLLQDSLGGNAKTRVVCCLSPSPDCVEESVNTLRFADRAREVMIFARVNEQRPIDHEYVSRLERENAHLHRVVARLLRNGPAPTEDVGGATTSKEPAQSAQREEGGGDGVGGSSQSGNNVLLTSPEKKNMRLEMELFKLREENSAVKTTLERIRAGGTEEDGTNKPAGPPKAYVNVADLHDLQNSKEALKRVMEATDKFFKFEIEEEDLRAFMESVTKEIKKSTHSSALSIDNISHSYGAAVAPTFSVDIKSITKNRMKGGGTSPSPGLAFRVRGKAPESITPMKVPEQEDLEAKLGEEMKIARAKLKKQLQLQQWLKDKEEKELAKIKLQEEVISAQLKAKADEEKKFKDKAEATKRKLESMKMAKKVADCD